MAGPAVAAHSALFFEVQTVPTSRDLVTNAILDPIFWAIVCLRLKTAYLH